MALISRANWAVVQVLESVVMVLSFAERAIAPQAAMLSQNVTLDLDLNGPLEISAL